MAFDNGQVVLDGNASRIDVEAGQQLDHRHRFLDLVAFAIQGDVHGMKRCAPCPTEAVRLRASVARGNHASQGKLLMTIELCS